MSEVTGRYLSNEQDSQELDDKMDTGSESPPSIQEQLQHPVDSNKKNSAVLRLQNPLHNVEHSNNEIIETATNILRLRKPLDDNEMFAKYRETRQDSEEMNESRQKLQTYADSPVLNDGFLNESLMNDMSKLQIDSKEKRQSVNSKVDMFLHQEIGVSPLKTVSALTFTVDHPLMALPEIEIDYPDIVPEKPRRRTEDEGRDLSSSVEDEKTHGSFNEYYNGPLRNTSKNNLYFSDNFGAADDLQDAARTPDVARVQSLPKESRLLDKVEATRRKIVPCFSEFDHLREENDLRTPRRIGRPIDNSTPTVSENVNVCAEERKKELLNGHNEEPGNTEKSDAAEPIDIPRQEIDSFGPVEWAESPSHLRNMSSIQLPVELSSNAVDPDVCGSPDMPSSSTTEDLSQYRAMLDPASGSVLLQHSVRKNNSSRRRIIAVQHQDTEDRVSLEDSGSVCSLPSEEVDLTPQGDYCPADVAPTPSLKRDVDKGSSDDESHRNTLSDCSEPIPEYSSKEERENERSFKRIPLSGGGHMMCDMKVIEPYMRVLSHGGYSQSGSHIIVFSACYLPHSTRKDYNYVIDNLFLYVLWTLDRLVTDEYEMVYLHGSSSKHRVANLHWLNKSYQLIDRRLRKSLKHLYLVHPTFWLKSIVFMSKPFISSKFSRKLTYVHSLAELYERVPVEQAAIPQTVVDYDRSRQR